jgi:hypothetical protein
MTDVDRISLPDLSAVVCDSAVTLGGNRVAAERTEGLGKITGKARYESMHRAQ